MGQEVPPSQVELSEEIQLQQVDPADRVRLDRARALIAEQRWSEAVDTLRMLVEGSAEGLVSPASETSSFMYRHYLPIDRQAGKLLLQVVRADLDSQRSYLQSVDDRAGRAWRAARSERNEPAMQQVAEQFHGTSSGRQAWYELGALALQRGDFLRARSCWEELDSRLRPAVQWPEREGELALWFAYRYLSPQQVAGLLLADVDQNAAEQPAPSVEGEDVNLHLTLDSLLAHLTLVSILEEDLERATWELELLRQFAPETRLPIAGGSAPACSLLADLLAQAEQYEMEQGQVDQEQTDSSEEARGIRTRRPGGWQTWGGDGTRNGATQAPVDLAMRTVWSRSLRPLPGVDQATEDYFGFPSPRLVESAERPYSRCPIVFDGVLYLADDSVIQAFDLASGAPAWGGSEEAAEDEGVIFRGPRLTGDDRTQRPPAVGVSRYTLTVCDEVLLARMGNPYTYLPARFQGDFEPGYLVALDLRSEGRLLPGFPLYPDQEGWAFEGTPILADGCLYVAMRQNDLRPHLHVACFDLSEAPQHEQEIWHPKWRTLICGSQTITRGQSAEISHGLLTLVGEQLYVNTNQGVVAAIERKGGSVVWLTTYPRSGPAEVAYLQQPWHLARDLNPALYHQGVLYVAPSDCERIFALEASSGELIWQTTLPGDVLDVAGLLGVGEGHLVAGGRRLWWFDTATGQLSHRVTCNPFPGPQQASFFGQGRGAIGEGVVYWPTAGQRQMLYLFDLASGQMVRQPFPLAAAQAATGNVTIAERQLILTTNDRVMLLNATGQVEDAR